MTKLNHKDITTWELPEEAIARLGKGKVSDVAFSPDNESLAVATSIGLWWYALATMEPVALWETERGLVSAVSFSNDGKSVATGNIDGSVKVWKTQNQRCILEIGKRVLNGRVSQLTFSPDGKHLAASHTFADSVGTVPVWSVETGAPIAEFTVEKPKARPAPGVFRPLCFSPDGVRLAYRSSDNTISVTHLETQKHIAHFNIDTQRVDSLVFSPCGQFLAAGIRKKTDSSRTAEVHVWNIPKETLEIVTEYDGYQVKLTYATEGTLRVADIYEDKVVISDAFQQDELDTFEHHGDSRAARFSGNGQQFAIASARDFHVWQADTPKVKTLPEHLAHANAVIFSQEGRTLVSGPQRGGGIVFWDVAKRQLQRKFQTDVAQCIAVAADEKFLATGFLKTIEIWHIPSGTRLTEFTEPRVSAVAFSPTGEHFASAAGDGELYLWDVQHWEKHHTLIGHTGWIRYIAFRPDGQQLVSASMDKTARVWDVADGSLMTTLPLTRPLDTNLYKGDHEAIERALEIASKPQKSRDNTVWSITFSPCGNLIAGGMRREIRLWNAATYETHMVILPPEESRRPFALAFSPCGQYLASGTWWYPGSDKVSIRLWKVATGENIKTFWGHPTDVQNLTFSPDGTLLATSGFDGTILLWDMKPYIS